MTSLGGHLGIIGRPARFARREPFVRHVQRRGHARIAARKAIADHRAARNPEEEP
jgi:hypothetical protein